MTVSVKNLLRKLTNYIYGDFSVPNDDLEKLIKQAETNEPETYTYPEPEMSSSSLYIPTVESCDDNSGFALTSVSEYEKEKGDKELNLDEDSVSIERSDDPSSVTQPSDLDSLLEDLANLISETDTVKEKLDSIESKNIIQFCQERILECMAKHSLETFGNDIIFNNKIHNPQPFNIVPNGTPIVKCLRYGLRKNNKIFVKAIVEVSLTNPLRL